MIKLHNGTVPVTHRAFTYVCNGCEKDISSRTDQEVITIVHTFGYGSPKDLERHELHLCEECYDGKLLQLLKIQPNIREVLA